MTGAGEILASNCKKPLLHNVWNPKVSWWQATYCQKPTLWSCWWFPAVCGSPSCKWNLRQSNSIKSRLLNLTKQCVSQIEAGLESLYPVFKDASIKRFVPQLGNKTAQTLCALCTASFWLEVKDPSQSRNNCKKSWWELNSTLLRRQDFKLEDRFSISISNKSFNKMFLKLFVSLHLKFI